MCQWDTGDDCDISNAVVISNNIQAQVSQFVNKHAFKVNRTNVETIWIMKCIYPKGLSNRKIE